MSAQNDAGVGVLNQATGKIVRTIEVTTIIAGVPTVVEMQAVAVSDGAGNVIEDFASYKMQLAVIQELRAIKDLLSQAYGLAVFTQPTTP
jgi:hypothetical protein